jgi:chemotaxis protein MotD
VPHVASDWKSQGLNRLLQQAGKQGYTSASQKTTPFDSILDETSRPAPEPRTQRPTDDNSPRTERGQRTKSADRPNRTAKSDDKAKPSATDAPAKADSDADSTKIDDAGTKATDAKATDTKSADATSGDKASDQTATSDDVSAAAAAADTNPAGPVAVVPVAVVIDPAATLTSNSTATTDAKDEAKVESTAIGAAATTATPAAPTATAASGTAKAIAETAANPATAAVATAETTPETTVAPAAAAPAASTATAASKVTAAAGQADVAAADVSAEAALTQARPNALAALGAKADKAEKADLKSDKKAEADKKAASAQTTFKPTVALDPKAAQADNGEPAKDTGTHAHAEATASSHRGVTADAANTAATNDGNAIVTVSKAPDLTPPPGLTVQTPTHGAPAQTVAAPIAVAAQTDNSQPAVPIAGVAFEITSKALSGRNQFDIRLDPPDLGRIHVRLDVDRDGNVITHMVADRTDTLDLLRKDTAGLERALQDAGLKTSDNSLQFSLRDQQANQQQRNGGGESAHVIIEDEQLAAIEPAQRNYTRYNAATGGLDIRV